MNNIGFGIFCFGEEYYYKGTVEKIKNILNEGYHCYVLTENPNYFKLKFTDTFLHTIPYKRNYKSYADKMILPKHILSNHDYCILIDADTHIKDYSFLKSLKTYDFKCGISYIDTLENHAANKKYVKELINTDGTEWNSYHTYASKIYPNYGDFETMWEYFLIFNKVGFKENLFYNYYEKLQVAKEFCDLTLNKEINGAGEGISIHISAKLSDSDVQRDLELYEMLKDKMMSVSKRHTRMEFWPEWMK